MDFKKLLRLRASINSLNTLLSEKGTSLSYMEPYNRLRNAVQGTLDDELRSEFLSLLPEVQERNLKELSALITILKGYLDGLIEAESYEAQIRANAEAYAIEKIKEERGVGFRK